MDMGKEIRVIEVESERPKVAQPAPVKVSDLPEDETAEPISGGTAPERA